MSNELFLSVLLALNYHDTMTTISELTPEYQKVVKNICSILEKAEESDNE